MNTAPLDVRLPHFTSRTIRSTAALVVALSGNADEAARANITELVKALHVEALSLHVEEVVLDVRELYFMNSTCLSILLRWINVIRKHAESPAYRLRFTCNSNLRWQKRSLQSLALLGGAVVVVD